MPRVAFVVLAFLAAAVAGRAAQAQTPTETPITVDELVTRAVADNPELRAARAEVDAAGGRLQQAGLRPNPMLDLGAQKALGPDNNVMIGVTLPLDLNGRKEGRVGVAERELAMRRTQVRDRERRLAADVRMKAGELLAARRNLSVTGELLGANQDALRLVRHRIREGASPAIEENLMLVEVNRLDAARVMLASRVTIAMLQLKALAGLGPDALLVLRGELSSPPASADGGELLRRALAGRPDLMMARTDVSLGAAKVRKEEADGRWDASINVGYQRQDVGFMLNGLTNSGATRPIQDVFHYFGAGVSITLPVRNRNEGNVAAATAEARAAERRLEFAELTVRQEVRAAVAQDEAVRRSLALYERGVRDVAAQNLAVVRQTYELGRVTLLDVIAEQRRYIEIENGYTEVLKLAYDAGVEIQRAVGTMMPGATK